MVVVLLNLPEYSYDMVLKWRILGRAPRNTYIHVYIRRNQPVNTVETESKNKGEEMRVKSCASTRRKSRQDWNLVNWKCVY